jgi:hypothetical protein
MAMKLDNVLSGEARWPVKPQNQGVIQHLARMITQRRQLGLPGVRQ